MVEKKKILFLIEAVTAAHLIRVLPLAQSLVKKFRVIIASLEPPHDLVREFRDIEFLPLTTSVPPKEFLEVLYQGRLPYDESRLRQQLAEDIHIIQRVRPNLVVIDFRLSACLSVPPLGIPLINLQNAFWSPNYLNRSPCPDIPLSRGLGPSLFSLFEKIIWNQTNMIEKLGFLRILRPFNKLRREFHLPPFSRLQELYSFGTLLLHPDPREFFVGCSSWKSVFLGPVTSLPRVARAEWIDRLDPQKPTIYVSLGSSGQSEKLLKILPKLVQGPIQWILISKDADVLSLKAENVFTDRFASLPDIVPLLDFAILNGGSAQGYFFLSSGIPFLGIPSNMDQHLFTQILVRHRLAVSLRSEAVNFKDVQEIVQRCLQDEDLKKRCEEFAEILKDYQPIQAFGLEVERLLNESHPTGMLERIPK